MELFTYFRQVKFGISIGLSRVLISAFVTVTIHSKEPHKNVILELKKKIIIFLFARV
jgi:hypothetical protein